ncbi:DUF3341 domain-containing protein [Anaeromyxobacter paludicola]|uniref:Quinol:cytochrome c oxidoreductase membrane protein n=1 Tax=Anaeromyxobacter paludicola TaxID=2918171 RepID=A0ABM7XF44_9BACT|nr:DUF3341 domain-containing protein [Anaeromyxobacter paludicola]BDG10519.1 hypothetical protein AMPC_36320 [Anaeromyxobacter paludicola]
MSHADPLVRSFVLAEFAEPEALFAAARKVRAAGHTALDAHMPYPVHGADEALGIPHSRVPLIALCGGLTGVVTAYLMAWWMNAVDYRINVAGRPFNAIPAFVPVMFELGVLFASLSIFVGCILLFRLPRLHHPVFEADAFRSASVDKFWLSVETADPAPLEEELRRAGASVVQVVEGQP